MSQLERAKVATLDKLTTKGLTQAAKEAKPKPAPDGEAHGIQDLLELITLIEAVAELIIETVADGISPLDLFAVFRADEVRAAIGPAFDDIGDVGPELADLSVGEMQRLMQRLMDVGFSIFDTIKDELL